MKQALKFARISCYCSLHFLAVVNVPNAGRIDTQAFGVENSSYKTVLSGGKQPRVTSLVK